LRLSESWVSASATWHPKIWDPRFKVYSHSLRGRGLQPISDYIRISIRLYPIRFANQMACQTRQN